MARVPDFPPTPLPTSTGLPRTVQCPECGVVLNVPPSALGRRLKCPRCETRFATPQPEGSSSTTIPTLASGNAASSMYAPHLVTDGSGTGSSDYALPNSPPPLRDQFDLPSLSGLESTPPALPITPPTDPDAGAALSLFQDEPRTKARPKTGAEARSQARRCPTCSGVVPVGMSLCSRCGLDLDTGQRIDPLEMFDDAPAAPRSTSFPMAIAIIGGVSVLASVILAIVSAVAWQNELQGAGFLLAICVFGVYASIQFLRRKSARLLLVALSLGLLVDVMGLIALPIYRANSAPDPFESIPSVNVPANNPLEELEGPRIQNLEDRLDMRKISWGVTLMLSYAAIAVYLQTPSFRRQFARH